MQSLMDRGLTPNTPQPRRSTRNSPSVSSSSRSSISFTDIPNIHSSSLLKLTIRTVTEQFDLAPVHMHWDGGTVIKFLCPGLILMPFLTCLRELYISVRIRILIPR